MISAQELRIGNYVNRDIGRGHYQLVQLTIASLGYVNDEPNIHFPIPLTPEILEKCGFEYDYYYSEKWFSPDIGYICKCEGGYFVPDSDGENSLAYALKYLHELQNLFYWLTKKELTLNL